ncbi:MAG: YciI family protein [Nitrosomonas sp.]|uniref:YciI family protein n=1 Tax=Nitrosomonas sp. TaxID=42353 RepID=UPI001DB823D0|nr:YciI family protein [Nitrosomonas sp.]MBX9895482.1 YciI family protein [Nitrosomonas sp.]
MLYMINGEDVPDSLEKRMTVRSQHLSRIQALQEEGRLILAGPFPAIDSSEPGPAGFSGSLIVAEFESLEAAKVWANEDPYVSAGVYQRVTVKPFKKVLPS